MLDQAKLISKLHKTSQKPFFTCIIRNKVAGMPGSLNSDLNNKYIYIFDFMFNHTIKNLNISCF